MAGSKKAASKKTSRSAKKTSVSKEQMANSAPDAVDEQLARYRSMRDFKITAEPSGGHFSKGTQDGLPFCVQKHAASHLHYEGAQLLYRR
jgi:bifunctional non-homologous end joining protein LigD